MIDSELMKLDEKGNLLIRDCVYSITEELSNSQLGLFISLCHRYLKTNKPIPQEEVQETFKKKSKVDDFFAIMADLDELIRKGLMIWNYDENEENPTLEPVVKID